MVLELSKKTGRERLRGIRTKTRENLFKNSSFLNKTAALQERHKHNFRIQGNYSELGHTGTPTSEQWSQVPLQAEGGVSQ